MREPLGSKSKEDAFASIVRTTSPRSQSQIVNRVVRPDDIDDLSAQVMARDIAKQVEEELQ
jgi:hypothetical protein